MSAIISGVIDTGISLAGKILTPEARKGGLRISLIASVAGLIFKIASPTKPVCALISVISLAGILNEKASLQYKKYVKLGVGREAAEKGLITNLKDLLNQRNELFATGKAEADEMAKINESTNRILEELEEKLEVLNNDNLALDAEVTALNNSVAELKNEIAQLALLRVGNGEDLERLRDQIAEARGVIGAMKVLILELEEENKNLKAKSSSQGTLAGREIEVFSAKPQLSENTSKKKNFYFSPFNTSKKLTPKTE